MFGPQRTVSEHVLVYVFILTPFLALVAAVTLAWGWGLTWLNIGLATGFYVLTGTAVTIGLHRLFTHGSFKAARPLRIALAVAGIMAMQGEVTEWVADHRRHHAFSDRNGDPHSPWRYGPGVVALGKGFWHAHLGWIFDRGKTNATRFAPDLLADGDIRTVDRWVPMWMALSLGLPAAIGGLATWSWWGALTAFFWASLVRISLLHHVTWSINSVCHMIGDRPFRSRDKAANFWPLAILSFGESWHNSHHADPTCARHGVRRGQIDISARMIWMFEKFGWVWDVRWPTQQRLDRLAVPRPR
ncbi:MAG TPA: acyl-CoA desaturase [Pseudonocardiaceae bacterium]|jgi:stearoyl-CoA desaturase (delta-9 desaturase)|nr:acyl-CoA desaturase [Pseudonocardiaceae bacterium]